MIDQKALSHAWHVMDHLFQHEDFEREDFEKAIEAYEAALWRPIEDAPRDGSEILIHWPQGGPSALSGNWLTRWSHEGCWGYGKGALTPDSPLLKGAMFRTIDLPTQDAVSRATSTPPAAEASS